MTISPPYYNSPKCKIFLMFWFFPTGRISLSIVQATHSSRGRKHPVAQPQPDLAAILTVSGPSLKPLTSTSAQFGDQGQGSRNGRMTRSTTCSSLKQPRPGISATSCTGYQNPPASGLTDPKVLSNMIVTDLRTMTLMGWQMGTGYVINTSNSNR